MRCHFEFTEFAQIIMSIVNGAQSTVRYMAAVEDDPQRRRPDISRAKKYLNWEPKVFVLCVALLATQSDIKEFSLKVSLEVGLRKAIEYFRREIIRSSMPNIPKRSTREEEKELW